jgi:hypothetical protein
MAVAKSMILIAISAYRTLGHLRGVILRITPTPDSMSDKPLLASVGISLAS